jgi:isocitrate/isopropylmalate dehydrogenase
MSNLVPITVAPGDGIGPEIMDASLDIITEAGARLQIETIEIGEKVYLCGNTAGIGPSTWTVRDQGIDIVKTENLRTFDGQVGYTLARGQ